MKFLKRTKFWEIFLNFFQLSALVSFIIEKNGSEVINMYSKNEQILIHPELTLDELIYQAYCEAKAEAKKLSASGAGGKIVHSNFKNCFEEKQQGQ